MVNSPVHYCNNMDFMYKKFLSVPLKNLFFDEEGREEEGEHLYFCSSTSVSIPSSRSSLSCT